MNKDDKKELVSYRIARARETFKEVNLHIENKLWNTAINRLYYACYYAVTALLFKFCFRENFPELLGGTRELSKVFFEKIPVKQITEDQELPFKERVTQILAHKKEGKDISHLEKQIDQMIYKLYELTEEEIKIVEEAVK